MSNYEKNLALRQGHGIASEDGYFEARPQIDSMDRRKVFGAGFERGWEAALAAEPAQERIQALELEVRQLTEQIAELRHAPTPQADSQPAPLREGEWINDAGRIKWLMWRVQDLEAKLAARAPADSVLEDADPLQGAANWLAQAHGQFCVAVLQGCLMIGYNRAKRLHDASIAARKQGANHD